MYTQIPEPIKMSFARNSNTIFSFFYAKFPSYRWNVWTFWNSLINHKKFRKNGAKDTPTRGDYIPEFRNIYSCLGPITHPCGLHQ